MPTDSDNVAAAFRQTYGQLVAQTPTSDAEWPPVVTIRTATVHRSWPGWIVAGAAFLVTISFWVGWLVAAGRATPAADPFQFGAEVTTAVAVPETAGTAYTNPADAAVAAALSQAPDLDEPHVTRMVGVYADDTTVDLRVQVQASDFCNWYGVTGTIREEALEWRSRPALPCDG